MTPTHQIVPGRGVTEACAPRDGALMVIDVLRGVAALGVLIYHARVTCWVGWSEIQNHPAAYSEIDRLVAWLSAPAPFLGSLVMLFFVVSGFCVHQPSGGELRSFGVLRFFRRRFLRIFPPYLVAVLLSLGASVVLRDAVLPDRGILTALMLQNYANGWHLPAAAGQPGCNPALWSLPVELELYLVYPALWWLAGQFGWGAALGAVGVAGLAALVAFHAGLQVFDGNFAMYWLIWSTGAWLRERWSGGTLPAPPRYLAAAAWLSLPVAAWLTMQTHGGLGKVSWGLFYFWLVWAWLAPGRREFGVGRVWCHALAAVGRWSFSLYLVHFPLLALAGAWWVAERGAKPASFLVTLAAATAVLPLAWIFHVVIERPSHGWARRDSRRNSEST